VDTLCNIIKNHHIELHFETAENNQLTMEMENELLCYKIKVTGKVQGVWFRDSTLKKAEELGVKGFVKNQPDGSVYIEAEGKKSVLNDFIKWCKEGPPFAKVEAVEVKKIEITYFEKFKIVW
jgi:acylphosphatase